MEDGAYDPSGLGGVHLGDRVGVDVQGDAHRGRARYDGIAWAVGTTLDGIWSYEDCRAAYVPVGRPENRHQAAEVGAFLLEGILHWALARKQPDRQALVIDEFSKLSDRPGAAVDLVERARSFNVAVVLIAQAWASLGPDDTIRNRLAGTVGTVIAHQLKQPDDVAEAFIIHGGQAVKLRIRPPRSAPSGTARLDAQEAVDG